MHKNHIYTIRAVLVATLATFTACKSSQPAVSADSAQSDATTMAVQQQHTIDSVAAVASADSAALANKQHHDRGYRTESSNGTVAAQSQGGAEVRHTDRDAAIGAAAGAIVGATSSRNKLQGGVIGGVVGGVLGGVVGNNVDVKKTRRDTLPRF